MAESPEKQAWSPEPAESFLIEFLHDQKKVEALNKMGFSFRSSQPEGDDKVVITGERQNGDGTTVEMTITRGASYKSPKELADLEAAAKAKAEKNKK
jgi:hypothetical protein